MPASRIPLLVVVIAAAIGSACSTRRPPESVPNATLPDGTPRIPVDSSTARPQQAPPEVRRVDLEREDPPVFLALTADAHMMQLRATDGPFPVPNRSIVMTALEGQFAPLRGFGVGAAGRILFGGDDVPAYSDAALLLGWRWLSADLGFASRRSHNILQGGIYDSTFLMFRPGVRSRVNVGQTGLSVHGRAARYFALPEPRSPGARARLRGSNFELGASYTIDWRYPLSASVGMRREFIQVWDRRQRVNALTLGLGLLIGRQPDPLPRDSTQ